MLMLEARTHEHEIQAIILMFGIGLVGKSILNRLEQICRLSNKRLKFDWDGPSQTSQVVNILTTAKDRLDQLPSTAPVHIVWSAGAAGFSATQEIVDQEFVSFQHTISLCENLFDHTERKIHYHLISSAGGLFEGQRFVNANTRPAPRRPYATAKLRQEMRLKSMPGQIGKHIYRPSSVYGYTLDGRPGLILTLLRNGFQQRISSIFGNQDTMRDFIYAPDVGRFIGDRLLAPKIEDKSILLASGSPSSMQLIIQKVERILDRNLYLQFDPHPSNSAHNTYAASALSHLTHITPLDYGIRRCAAQCFAHEFEQR